MRARKVAAAIVTLAGAALIVVPLATHMFTRADQAQKLLDGARPIVAPPHLQDKFEAGLASVRRTQQQLTGTVFAQLATDLGQTPAQFQMTIQDRWPAIARGEQKAAAIDATTTMILKNLLVHQQDYQRADAIPTSGFALVSAIWFLVIFGVLVLAAGLWMLLRPGWIAPLAVTLLGAIFVVSAFALALPSKASSAHRVIASLNLSPAKNAKLQADLSTVQGSFDQLQRALLPQVAAQLGISTSALQSRLEVTAPGLTAGLNEVPTITRHFGQAIQFRINNVDNFPPIRDYPFQTLMWVAIGLGGVVLVGGVVGLAATRAGRPDQVPASSRGS